MDLQPISIGL